MATKGFFFPLATIFSVMALLVSLGQSNSWSYATNMGEWFDELADVGDTFFFTNYTGPCGESGTVYSLPNHRVVDGSGTTVSCTNFFQVEVGGELTMEFYNLVFDFGSTTATMLGPLFSIIDNTYVAFINVTFANMVLDGSLPMMSLRDSADVRWTAVVLRGFTNSVEDPQNAVVSVGPDGPYMMLVCFEDESPLLAAGLFDVDGLLNSYSSRYLQHVQPTFLLNKPTDGSYISSVGDTFMGCASFYHGNFVWANRTSIDFWEPTLHLVSGSPFLSLSNAEVEIWRIYESSTFNGPFLSTYLTATSIFNSTIFIPKPSNTSVLLIARTLLTLVNVDIVTVSEDTVGTSGPVVPYPPIIDFFSSTGEFYAVSAILNQNVPLLICESSMVRFLTSLNIAWNGDATSGAIINNWELEVYTSNVTYSSLSQAPMITCQHGGATVELAPVVDALVDPVCTRRTFSLGPDVQFVVPGYPPFLGVPNLACLTFPHYMSQSEQWLVCEDSVVGVSSSFSLSGSESEPTGGAVVDSPQGSLVPQWALFAGGGALALALVIAISIGLYCCVYKGRSSHDDEVNSLSDPTVIVSPSVSAPPVTDATVVRPPPRNYVTRASSDVEGAPAQPFDNTSFSVTLRPGSATSALGSHLSRSSMQDPSFAMTQTKVGEATVMRSVVVRDAKASNREVAIDINITSSVGIIDLNDPDMVKVAFLGTGAFGDVFHYRKKINDYAVKTMKNVSSSNVVEFVEEAQMLAGLRHENCVTYVGICTNPLAIVTEFMSGGDLAHYLEEVRVSGKKPARSVLYNFMFCISKGLYYLHDNGIPHRDLKPANILLTKKLDAKIADFGLSGEKKSTDVSGAGTPRYCPPEVLDGEACDMAGDMYSFASIAYETITLDRVFNYPGCNRLIDHWARPIPNMDMIVVAQEELRDILKRCWEPDKRNRPSMSAIASQLMTMWT